MTDYTKPEEAVKHLDKVGTTYGVDINTPFSGYKGKYVLSLSYLGKEYFRLDTSVFDKTLDEMLKESDKDVSWWCRNNNNDKTRLW